MQGGTLDKTCPSCKRATVIVLREEQDTFKGVMQEHPLYYKYCKSCHFDFVDKEVQVLNNTTMKGWVKELND